MERKARFRIVYSKEAIDFLESLDERAREKIAYNISKAMYVVDKELFKKLEGSDIWEFRTLYNGTAYRLLAFWDSDSETLVIATHGFIKKKQKTPEKEIAKAERIREMYFNTKKYHYENDRHNGILHA
ncbi:MAG: type II toxin-antitoxin system RelE/ParE family toxin [bacterium]|uniref:Type II toxin-antitoxin system RelE/ParE family toxin n=1 Tax=Candidatus Aphodosoma intestinipullorum TaxID=2840674 RepID=A0A940DKW9_9BACT|nr:type II toxin-antitoxin system RelE/ParE family toxin [Candidatus Aphodosoma intestinipullorum]